MPSAVLKDFISASNTPAIIPRKRTMSFSSSQPPKSARTPLRRTGSFLSLADISTPWDIETSQARSAVSLMAHIENIPSVPYTRTLHHYREQREQRKAVVHVSGEAPPVFTVTPVPAAAAPPAKAIFPRQRTNSPLSQGRDVLPPRTHYPRSKPEPDLYRLAITARMRLSPEGQKILHMGPRLALSIHAATLELERIVAAQRDTDYDISMSSPIGNEPLLSTSWVVIPPEDWEMVDGSW